MKTKFPANAAILNKSAEVSRFSGWFRELVVVQDALVFALPFAPMAKPVQKIYLQFRSN